ncbi:hypothetical protein ACTXT7_003150 [Hymenolepis weldensis]
MSASDWFHPSLSKSETEKVFASSSAMQDGAFLVRRSSQSDRKFVLVLYYQRQTLKYQIEVVDFSFHLDTKEAYFIDKWNTVFQTCPHDWNGINTMLANMVACLRNILTNLAESHLPFLQSGLSHGDMNTKNQRIFIKKMLRSGHMGSSA